LRRRLEERGEAAFEGFIKRSDDRRLERTIGSDRGLRFLFGQMTARYAPEKAAGFAGDIEYDLKTAGGEVKAWTVTVGPSRAAARPGSAVDPALKITIGVADFVRMAGNDLDPGKALLTGRLDLAGDFGVAQKLGEMFGRPPAV
jgi:putative sterol carrier protein